VNERLRVVVADDERPARLFLSDLLRGFPDVEVAGEAANGSEAVKLIEAVRPDLALLDLQMPEVDGLGVVRLLGRGLTPLVAFVTAHDEYAVKAFEVNAIDYLLKPVAKKRLLQTLDRAKEQLERPAGRERQEKRLRAAVARYEGALGTAYLERIPVRRREEILILPVEQVASIEAEGELLHLTTLKGERHTISYRLKNLEARLDPGRFVRLSRGALANIRMITRFSPMPGGTYLALLANRQELSVSRSQARILRDRLMRL
jgi:two-component system, LytTR family, response regulator